MIRFKVLFKIKLINNNLIIILMMKLNLDLNNLIINCK